MKAIEVFKSHQGEGKFTGTLMTFIRFKVCKRPFNHSLCEMCDTMTKMNSCIEMSFEPKDIENMIRETNYNICFTGGEPTIYLKQMKEVIDYFATKINEHTTGCVHFETNGLQVKELITMLKETSLKEDKYFIAYSPKFFNELELADVADYINTNHELFNNNRTSIKIVVGESNWGLCKTYLSAIPKFLLPLICLMPMGVTELEIKRSMPFVSKLSMEFRVNISDRLHIIHTFM